MEGISRRGALAATAAAIGVGGAQAATSHAGANEPVKIRFCCRLYDRMLPLYTGAVKIQGVDLTFLPNSDHRAVFDAMENHQAFDVSELSFSDFITFTSLKPDYPIVAVPVFSSRVFRHSSIYVNRAAGITDAKQLEGKRVGIPRWGESAVIWARGMLQDEYGLDLSKVQWVTGAMNDAGVHGEVAETESFRSFPIEANKTGKSLSQLLEAGDLACVLGAAPPVAFGRNPEVVRLFPDSRAREKDWYRRTKRYPIMHVISMRRDVHDANPWLAARLVEACETAKQHALKEMRFTGSLLYMLPWLPDDLAEVHSVFGDDPWPYGIEANRPSIETEIRYLVEQGIIPHTRTAEDLFVPV
jgi:4,5-dihydroxyphthalate decarboxylase